MLKVYNTLSRQKEEFTPLTANKQINMYVCGVTVYDYCHVGHARAYVVFDMIRRYLEYLGYNINYIQNFTDVDDKIIKRANESHTQIDEITKKFIAAYYEDIDKLNIQRASVYPKATENIPGMIKHIEELIRKDFAYVINGEVFFRVSKFKDYGKLSGRKPDDNEAGARVDVNNRKENPLDFTLWKPAKEGEPAWDSPWGKGRPGWHIECSVMSLKEAGIETLDIHGGGQDLIFPHHENEIAQSEALTGKPFSKYWLHNGFVTIDKEKMSKSLGNFFTIRDVFKKFAPDVIRFFLLSTHYGSPINYSDQQLEEAKKRLHYLKETIQNNMTPSPNPFPVNGEGERLDNYKKEFQDFMNDDFNSAGAIGTLFSLATEVNKTKNQASAKLLKELGDILGIFYNLNKEISIPADIQELINQRNEVRKNKDWTAADKLKNEIIQKGWQIKDTPQGTKVEKI